MIQHIVLNKVKEKKDLKSLSSNLITGSLVFVEDNPNGLYMYDGNGGFCFVSNITQEVQKKEITAEKYTEEEE